jgi:YggT family protein
MDFIIFVINSLFYIYYILLALRAVLPWIPHNRMNPLVRPVYLLTEPVLSVIRAGLPPLRIGMDASPFIVIILLWIIHQVILRVIS